MKNETILVLFLIVCEVKEWMDKWIKRDSFKFWRQQMYKHSYFQLLELIWIIWMIFRVYYSILSLGGSYTSLIQFT